MKRNGLRAGRRAWLRGAAAAALVAAGMAQLRAALAAGTLPPGVAQIKGDVRINGKPAERGQRVGPGDVIVTGKGAELVMVVEKDAFLVRANSRVEFGSAAAGAVTALRLVTGALLSVFESGRRREINTATATIGIRGTGIYIETEAMRTYACTCYGEAVLTPVADPQYAETVRTRHHDQPRYIYGKGMPRMLEAAPVVNHTDIELQMLEALVGRKLPFDPKIY